MVFGNYAKYYNLLYKDKDYSGETDYIHSLIQEFATKQVNSVLDIGCGTGNHAICMSKLGYTITGIDLSEEMIKQARERKIENANFHVGNATTFELNSKYDVITSLFHVLSYQTDNNSVLSMVQNVSKHLSKDGLFVFDFWYGPAVLNEKPSVKIRRLADEEIEVTRIAEPVLKVNDNVVDVNFDLLINDKATSQLTRIKEVHPMRYFFKPEIEMILGAAQLQLLYFSEWMTGQVPSETTWGACCVALKK